MNVGTSYEEFLRRAEFIDSHLLFVRDTDGKDFGAYVSESWRMSKNKFFGTGETFLFKIVNGEAVAFKSTQLNQCY
jgi:TLD